jgi:hypothetical protein
MDSVGEKHKGTLLEWLRWLAVLPAAIGAYCVAQIVIILGGTIGAEMEGRIPMPDWVFQIINSIVPPICFIWAGAKTAPKYCHIVAIFLTVIFCIFTTGLLTYGILMHYARYPTWWFITTGVVSIISATVSCIYFQIEKQ